ncbi:MAG: acyl--CoA ligase, partial [Clostridia bacterium]|nr:acyl--CoA ligase [Clostridia bacterium]
KSYLNETGCKTLFVIDSLFSKIEGILDDVKIENVIICSPSQSLSPLKRFLFNLKNKNNISSNKVIEWRNFIATGSAVNITTSCMSPDDCCIIVHTGGTTGSPKSVMLSNANLNMAAFQPMNSPLLMKRRDKFFNIMPPFIAYGIVLGMHTAACMGWYSYLFPKFDPDEFATLIKKHKPQGIMGVPTHYEKLMNDDICDNLDLSFLKVALAGGDKTSVAFENKINSFFKEHNCSIHLSKGYSMTEASASATISYENANKIGSNGIPGIKTNMGVFNNDETECLYNEIGELCISTPTMMLGYHNNKSETENIIKKHKDGTLWIHTGDIGYIDEDGFVFVEGRKKRIIIRYDGFKIFPSQIEKVCLNESCIIDCCAVGVKDNSHSQGMLPIVFAVLKEDCEGDGIKVKLFELCKKELSEYMQPIDFVFIDEMPQTPIGKVDYKVLERKAEELM